MYVIIDKKSKAILHMSNSLPGEDKKPEEMFPDYDEKSMEFGRAPKQYITDEFTIENGVVKYVEDVVEEHKETLAEARERKLRSFSNLSLSVRQQIVPDYKLTNAALGVYSDEATAAIRSLIQLFRNEYARLKKAVAAARSIKEVDAIEAKFEELLSKQKPKKKTTRKTKK